MSEKLNKVIAKSCAFCNAIPIWQELSWCNRFKIDHKDDCFLVLHSQNKRTTITMREGTAYCPVSGEAELKAWNKRVKI